MPETRRPRRFKTLRSQQTMKNLSNRLLALGVGATLFLGSFEASAVSSLQSSNALFNALWQFEADTPLSIGLQMQAGIPKLKRCSADHKLGTRGEISRFQILPRIWQEYSSSRDYTNPDLAWKIAQKIIEERANWFRTATGHEPTPFDLYVMWNAPGHYQQVNFQRSRVKPLISEKAERFTNLVESSSQETFFHTAQR